MQQTIGHKAASLILDSTSLLALEFHTKIYTPLASYRNPTKASVDIQPGSSPKACGGKCGGPSHLPSILPPRGLWGSIGRSVRWHRNRGPWRRFQLKIVPMSEVPIVRNLEWSMEIARPGVRR